MLPNRLRPRYGLEKRGLIGVDLNREYKRIQPLRLVLALRGPPTEKGMQRWFPAHCVDATGWSSQPDKLHAAAIRDVTLSMTAVYCLLF